MQKLSVFHYSQVLCMLVLANAAQDFTHSCFWILFLDILYDPLDGDQPFTVELPVLHTDTKKKWGHISGLWERFKLTITMFKRLDHVTSVVSDFKLLTLQMQYIHWICHRNLSCVSVMKKTKWLLTQCLYCSRPYQSCGWWLKSLGYDTVSLEKFLAFWKIIMLPCSGSSIPRTSHTAWPWRWR